jgi:hypothetical protein
MFAVLLKLRYSLRLDYFAVAAAQSWLQRLLKSEGETSLAPLLDKRMQQNQGLALRSNDAAAALPSWCIVIGRKQDSVPWHQ